MLTTRMAFVLQPGPTVTEGILQYLLDVKICKSINQTCSDDEIQVIHVRGDTVPLSDDIIKFINVKLPVSVCNQLQSCCRHDEQEDAWNKKYFPTLNGASLLLVTFSSAVRLISLNSDSIRLKELNLLLMMYSITLLQY